MPTDIQRGELVDRLRTFLGVVGRLPLVLDEVVIPVVMAGDLNHAPYRRASRHAMKFVGRAATAAVLSGAGVELPLAAAGAFHVDGVLFANSEAVALQYELLYGMNPQLYTTYAQQGGFADTEIPALPSATTLRLTPLREFWAAQAASPGAGTTERIAVVKLLANTSMYLPLDVMLYPGYGLSSWCQTVNTAVGATFSGDYYPDASRS